MKVTVLQFDDRTVEQLGLMVPLLHANAAYAARHGYDYQFIQRTSLDLPVYWLKPRLCRHFLENGSDIVAWLDTDAVVHDQSRRIEDIFEGSEVMVGAPDHPRWNQPFNAGVFFVRGPGGARIMEAWSGLFAGTAWIRTDTAWVCETEWAGPDFEQGAFNAHLLSGLIADGALRLIDWEVLQSPQATPSAFTLHFAGDFKAGLPAYLFAEAAGVQGSE